VGRANLRKLAFGLMEDQCLLAAPNSLKASVDPDESPFGLLPG
jgi:hypothetical protein